MTAAGRGGPAWRAPAAALALAVLHFLARPLLVEWWGSPDLLAAAVLVLSMGVRPGTAAGAGFVLGILEEAVALGALGPLAIVYAVFGYLGSRSWDLVFTDTRLYLPLYLVFGAWMLIVANWWITPVDLTWRRMLLQAPVSALLTSLAAVPATRWSVRTAA